MNITLINPPHTAIGSRMPREHLPPLGLLSVGGPLIDAGFTVRLVDAEFGPMSLSEIVRETQIRDTDVVMLGHSGSSTARPTVLELSRLLFRTRLLRAGPALREFMSMTLENREYALKKVRVSSRLRGRPGRLEIPFA